MPRCFFCQVETTLTNEHVLSRPIADVAGLARATEPFWTVDGRTGLHLHQPIALEHAKVKMACAACNSGWMSRLEEAMAGVLRVWSTACSRLQQEQLLTVRAWMMKTFLVFGYREGGFRRALGKDGDGDPAWSAELIWHPAHARMLAKEQFRSATALVSVGAARRPPDSSTLTCLSTARIEGMKEKQGMRMAYGSWAITLPALELQLWVMVGALRYAAVSFPRGVTPLSPGLAVKDLPTGPRGLPTNTVEVRLQT